MVSTDATDNPPEPPRTGRHRATSRPQVFFAVLAMVFFAGPVAARALGEHAVAIENRSLSPLPSPADGWAFFPELNQWAIDHLPLRDRAVEANTSFSQAVFRELPATAGAIPSVFTGADGWLFLRED